MRFLHYLSLPERPNIPEEVDSTINDVVKTLSERPKDEIYKNFKVLPENIKLGQVAWLVSYVPTG